MYILIADTDRTRAEALAARLGAQTAGYLVQVAPSNLSLSSAVAELRPDVVIVDMARPDRDSLEQVRSATAQPAPVMLFVDEDDPNFMEEAIGAGVASYHVDIATIADIKPILRSAIALFRRGAERERRLAEAESALAERRLVDAAKRLLIQRDMMTEPAAHRFLQRRAMERQVRVAEVARALLGDDEEKMP